MYCIDSNSDEPIMLLDAQIGQDKASPEKAYINSSEFVRELLYLDSLDKKRIQIWINSPGGFVSDGMAIYHAILATKTKVDTLCVGQAYSIAGVIFQAGRKRIMMDYATLMYHNAYTESGEKDKGLDMVNHAIALMVDGRSWKDIDAVKKMMAQETFITAEDAEKAGLCDDVVHVEDLNKPRATTDAKANYAFATEYLNKIVLPSYKNQIIQPSMKKIAAILNLNPDATEDSIALEVTKILNKSKESETLETNLNTAKKALAKAEEEMNAFKKKTEEEETARNLKAEEDKKVKDMEDKKNADDKARAEGKAKILETITNRGLTLPQETIDGFVSLAGADATNLATVVKSIEAIPVTRKAPGIKNLASKDDTGIPLIPEGDLLPDGTKSAGSTKGVIDAINSFDFAKYKAKKVA